MLLQFTRKRPKKGNTSEVFAIRVQRATPQTTASLSDAIGAVTPSSVPRLADSYLGWIYWHMGKCCFIHADRPAKKTRVGERTNGEGGYNTHTSPSTGTQHALTRLKSLLFPVVTVPTVAGTPTPAPARNQGMLRLDAHIAPDLDSSWSISC